MLFTHVALAQTEHRPWPAPVRPWLWSQHWLDACFAHWRVAPAMVSARLPAGLELDTWDGAAWVSAVPFRMAHVRPRWLPPLPVVSYFLELNLRTYVTRQGKRGVYFLSIHAGRRLAAWLSRQLSALAYTYAPMSTIHEAGRSVFDCRRPDAPTETLFRAEFAPRGVLAAAPRGSLAEWLVERYCLYAAPAPNQLVRGEIQHARWLIQPAEATVDAAALGRPHGLDLAGPPVCAHVSPGVQTVAWSFDRVE